DSLLRRVLQSMLLSTMAFSAGVDVASLDLGAPMDRHAASALQHRILSVLGVPVIPRTRSTYDAFFDAVAAAIIEGRPEQATLDKLISGAALGSVKTAELATPTGSTRAWVKGDDVPGSVMRLFCLPYGSGTTDSYHGWQEELELSGIEVRPIQMPGRADR